MHKMTFFPLGNADCCRIDLECGKKILFDYADLKDPDDEKDLRFDLPSELRKDLKNVKKDYFDVVAFTHLDRDHFAGFSEFFYLDHAKEYQKSDRIKIKAMWVPAALITEEGTEDDEARILRKEARYRFKEGRGIRVFSRPERLKEWCEKNDVKLAERINLITDAGKVAPEFSLKEDSVEFFVHSPFAFRLDDAEVEDRNQDCIVMQTTFSVEGVQTKALLTADTKYEALSDIVNITKRKKNESRLEWDIVKIPHHCSYLSLGPEKGEDKTEPVKEITWLYEEKGQDGAKMVSPSDPIPAKGTDEDKKENPPHRQAAAYYKDIEAKYNGEFAVTMEHPSKSSPEPIIIEIGKNKATLKKTTMTGGAVAISQRSPRAG